MEERDITLEPSVLGKEEIALYLQEQRNTKAETVRRWGSALKQLHEALPEDKQLTAENLRAWREHLEEQERTPSTILNYIMAVNRYLRWIGRDDLLYKQGTPKDLTGKRFGMLTAQYPTQERKNGGIVWHCVCDCGQEKDIPLQYLTGGHTTSCGCARNTLLINQRKMIDGTDIYDSISDNLRSNNTSGYTGVFRKNGKWAATITYRGCDYFLGYYPTVESAAAVRRQAKERVKEDAVSLLKAYYSTNPDAEPALWEKVLLGKEECIFPQMQSGNVENTHPGVSRRGERWLSHITWHEKTYLLGYFDKYEDAVAMRENAERVIRENMDGVEEAMGNYCGKIAEKQERPDG